MIWASRGSLIIRGNIAHIVLDGQASHAGTDVSDLGAELLGRRPEGRSRRVVIGFAKQDQVPAQQRALLGAP